MILTDHATFPPENITFDANTPLYWTQELEIIDNDIALEEQQFTLSLTPITSGVKVETGSCYWDMLTINIEDNDGKSCTQTYTHVRTIVYVEICFFDYYTIIIIMLTFRGSMNFVIISQMRTVQYTYHAYYLILLK